MSMERKEIRTCSCTQQQGYLRIPPLPRPTIHSFQTGWLLRNVCIVDRARWCRRQFDDSRSGQGQRTAVYCVGSALNTSIFCFFDSPIGQRARKNIVKLLIEHNADVNIATSNGFTPLHAAAEVSLHLPWRPALSSDFYPTDGSC